MEGETEKSRFYPSYSQLRNETKNATYPEIKRKKEGNSSGLAEQRKGTLSDKCIRPNSCCATKFKRGRNALTRK